MKGKLFFYLIIPCLILISIMLQSCSYEDEPIITAQKKLYPPCPPGVGLSILSVDDTSAVLQGSINFSTMAATIPLTDHGFYWWSAENPEKKVINGLTTFISSDNKTCFKATITGLDPTTEYYSTAFVRYKVGTNSTGGESASVSMIFTTLSSLPILYTNYVTEFSRSKVVVGGNIVYQGYTEVYERGVYLSLTSNSETSGTKFQNGAGLGSFYDTLTGLSPNTTYYVKAYGINKQGTSYGSENKFNTGDDDSFPQVTDADGNIYHIVTIGNQVWMAENLKTTKFNDKTAIPYIKGSLSFQNNRTAAYCYYSDDLLTNKDIYGALYNWYCVSSGKLCPAGWHVPSSEDWVTLANNLGGDSIAGGKLKETGTVHWSGPNLGATDQAGFTALPAGKCEYAFSDLKYIANWWSSTPTSYPGQAYSYSLTYNEKKIKSGFSYQQTGYSIRCIKDK